MIIRTLHTTVFYILCVMVYYVRLCKHMVAAPEVELFAVFPCKVQGRVH